MYTVVRSYFVKGAKELFDVLEKNKADVEKTMRSVKGFVSYALVRGEDGGFSVTVCNDKAGTDESVEKARDWIAKNAAGIGVAAPKLSEGSIVVDLRALNPALVSPIPGPGPPRANFIRQLSPPFATPPALAEGVGSQPAPAWLSFPSTLELMPRARSGSMAVR